MMEQVTSDYFQFLENVTLVMQKKNSWKLMCKCEIWSNQLPIKIMNWGYIYVIIAYSIKFNKMQMMNLNIYIHWACVFQIVL